MLRDPVCGMQVREGEAYAVRHVGDAQIALCSAACMAQFDAAPQHYLPLSGHSAAVRHAGSAWLLHPLAAGVAAVRCRALVGTYRAVVRLLPYAAEPYEPPTDLKQRILVRIVQGGGSQRATIIQATESVEGR